MIDRNRIVVGLLGLLAVVSAIGFGFMLTSLTGDACMSSSAGRGSCPALAEVQGVRYQVSAASPLIGLEPDLSPHLPIDRTNVPDDFSKLVTYRIGALDPTAVLAAPARPVREADAGPYRLLFGPNQSHAYPALCDYIPEGLRAGDSRCGAPA